VLLAGLSRESLYRHVAANEPRELTGEQAAAYLRTL
jgi:hypothetical protein